MVLEKRVLRVLRGILGSKRKEGAGEWRQFCNEKLHALYFSLIVMWVIKSSRRRGTGHVACSTLVVRPEGCRCLGTQRRRREDNIKMDVKPIGCESVDWIHLAQDRDNCLVLASRIKKLVSVGSVGNRGTVGA
jgi:hypothetical protein